MRSRRHMLTALLGSCLTASLRGQAPKRTVASVFETVAAWGVTAKSYSKRKWSKGRDELLDPLLGSTISFTAQLASRDITTSGGVATYEAALPIGPSYADALAEWQLQQLAPIWKETTLMGTVAFRFTTITYLVIQLTDPSGKLATDLTGTNAIRGTGQITELSVADSQVSISIDITSWQPA